MVAIILQGVLAIAIALWGKYGQILNYVVSVDFIFFGATAVCIFVFRRRAKKSTNDTVEPRSFFRVPGHPITTGLFVAICWLVVLNTIYKYPENTLIGVALLLAGVPAFYFWRARSK
jgi:APA family basic amino acid/polyamine antiporter